MTSEIGNGWLVRLFHASFLLLFSCGLLVRRDAWLGIIVVIHEKPIVFECWHLRVTGDTQDFDASNKF